MQKPFSSTALTMWLGFWVLFLLPFWVLPSMWKSFRIFSVWFVFSNSLNWVWYVCRYVGSSMAKARWMVLVAGGFFMFGKYCCSCCLCSLVKRAISTKSSAPATMAKKEMPIISFRGYLIFPCWRMSAWLIIFRFSKMLFMGFCFCVLYAI